MGVVCSVSMMLLAAGFIVLSRGEKNPPCRRRGGPCRFYVEHGHCVSPNGCRDWGVPPGD